MKLGIFGKGRLGSAIAQVAEAAEAAGVAVAWRATRDTPPSVPVDVAIEASSGAVVPQRLAWALERGVDLVIGSTGWSLPDLEPQVARRIGVVVAPNFSLTVALYARLALVLARYAAQAPDRDLYLLEHHHARKKDAPSGTAVKLAATLMKGCPRKTEWTIPTREPVAPHQLSVAAIRAGSTWSSHVVGLDSPGEVVELHHAARSARPYAEGALEAARFLREGGGRKGVFTMDDVAAERVAPLFERVEP